MRIRKLILLFLTCGLPSFGGIAATAYWDVNNSTGSNTNGGGFDPAKSGTFQASGIAFADLVCVTTTCTSATLAFGATAPGNILNITSGSGCSTGRREIVSQSGGTATLDSSAGTGTCTGRAYGQLATIAAATTVGQDFQTIWIQASGTPYAQTAALGDNGTAYLFHGYLTNHGDLDAPASACPINSSHCPVITSATNNNVLSPTTSAYYKNVYYWDLVISSTYGSSANCVIGHYNTGSAGVVVINTLLDVSAMPANSAGICMQNGSAFVSALLVNSEIKGAAVGWQPSSAYSLGTLIYDTLAHRQIVTIAGTSGTSYPTFNYSGSTTSDGNVTWTDQGLGGGTYGIKDWGNSSAWPTIEVDYSYIHGHTAAMWDVQASQGQQWRVRNSTIAANGLGLYQQFTGGVIDTFNVSFWANGVAAIEADNSETIYVGMVNDVISGYTHYGAICGGGIGPGINFASKNAFYGVTTPYSGCLPSSFFGSTDVTLTANPFTAPATADFSLNSLAGGGAVLKAAGFPGVASFGTGYLDIGALQSKAAAGTVSPYAYAQ